MLETNKTIENFNKDMEDIKKELTRNSRVEKYNHQYIKTQWSHKQNRGDKRKN